MGDEQAQKAKRMEKQMKNDTSVRNVNSVEELAKCMAALSMPRYWYASIYYDAPSYRNWVVTIHHAFLRHSDIASMDSAGKWTDRSMAAEVEGVDWVKSLVLEAFKPVLRTPESPKPALPWPPPQHLLDNFKYEVGGKLFTLFRYPVCARVQLKMSRDQASEGLVIECVATIGSEYDAILVCPFEHVSAVAAAIPRAEVFLRHLYEEKPHSGDRVSVTPGTAEEFEREQVGCE